MTSHLERRRGGGGRSGGGIAGGGGSSIWVPSLPKPKPAPKPAPQPAPLAAPKSAPHSAPHSTPMPGIRPAPKVGPTLKPKSGSWPIGKPKPKSGPKSGLLPWKKPHMPGHKPHHQWPGHSKPTISALTHSCHAPTGMDRLHCGALDAVLGMIGSFLLIIILATLVGWCIVRRKRKAKRACEEDGMELTSQAVENHRTQTPDTLVNVETPYRSITPTREREGRRHHPYQPSERSSHSFSEIRTATVAKRWGSAVIIDAISSRQSSRTDINKSQNMIFISNEPLPQQRCEWQDAAGGGVSKSSQSSSDPCQRDTYDRPDDGDSSSPSSRPSSQASPRSDEQEQIIQEGASETSSSRRSSQAASIGERGRNMLDDGPSRSFSTRPSSPDDAGWEEGTFAKAETEELEGRLE
ncbi:hypothetical protein MMC28_001894 [Mycoblastus sanguinarius]|nr:hypothetical protein [Mycoblastus sanguinarius]